MDLIYFNRCVEKQCFINWVIFNAGLETIFFLLLFFFFTFNIYDFIFIIYEDILFYCQYQL